ncbi:MAG: CHAT domain-containing protein [Blastocatellia bacterium]
MNTYSDENQIRRYLLGESSPAEREQIEEGLLRDDEFGDVLLACESELIDDYARNLLSADEHELFDKHFSYSPERVEKLLLAQAAVKYATANRELALTNSISVPQPEPLQPDSQNGDPQPKWVSPNENMTSDPQPKGLSPVNKFTSDPQPKGLPPKKDFTSVLQPKRVPSSDGTPGGRWQKLFAPGFVAAYALILVAVTIGGYLAYIHKPGTEQNTIAQKVTAELNKAYSQQRPFEARITGFDHAPFPTTVQLMGDKPEPVKVDSIAFDRAKYFLFEKEPQPENPKYRQAMGQYYLAQQKFDDAIKQLREGVRLAPEDAKLHADLGAALLGKIESDRQSEAGAKKEEVDECFGSLNKAIELDAGLLEAIFNRALLKQHEKLRREARADWQRYLQLDPNSSWAKEASEKLNQIEEELNKTSKKQEQRMKDFQAAYAARDSVKVLETVSQSYTFNGNYIFEELLSAFLAARQGGCGNVATGRFKVLDDIGDLVNSEKGDRYFSDLVYYYSHAKVEQIDLSAQARQLMREANFFYGKSQNDRAVELYQKAEALFIQAGNEAEPLFAKSWIGQCHHQRSDTIQNLKAFNEVLPVCAKKKYRWLESNANCGLANGHNSAGLFSQAIADSRRCGQIANELGDQIGIIRSQYMQGTFTYDLGKHEENLRLSLRGRELADKFSAGIGYAIAFYNLPAWSLSALGLRESAIAYQNEAVQMSEADGSPRLKAYAYIYLGEIYSRNKDFINAIANTQRGIAIGKELSGDGAGQDFEHKGLIHLGSIYRDAGQFSNALNAFEQAKSFYQRNNQKAYYFGASKGRLLTLISLGNDSEAKKELNQVIDLYEKYRQSIQEESNRNSFFDQEQDFYDVAIDFAYSRLNSIELALTYAEMNRARTLHDQLENGWEVVAAKTEFPNIISKSSQTSRNINEIRGQLPHEGQLLEYAVLDDKLLIWIIRQSGIHCQQVEVSAKRLNETVERFLGLIASAPDRTDAGWREPAADLYEMLFAPVEPLVDRRNPVYIIPDKQLARLPFGVLLSKTQRMLIEDFTIGYASSANMFLDATNRARDLGFNKQERFLAVGNPQFNRNLFPKLENLKVSEGEATTSAAFYPSSITLIGEKASKPMVLSALARADVAHLAMHYVPNQWSPMSSSLPFAPGDGDNGDFQMHELYKLKSSLPLRLILLSACQTRGEHFLDGEGAIGASRAFEAAGVPLVVSSLWPVDAKASAKLMVNFHRARKVYGQTAISALRTAQLEMIGESAHRHPFFWAAYVSVGGHTNY